jgi:hypothetical protein
MKLNRTWETAATVLAAAAIVALLAVGVFAQSAEFRFFGPLARVITPNGDGKNDVLFLCFDNPGDSDVSGKIYNLLGAEISPLGPRSSVVGGAPNCPAAATAVPAQFLTWDGRSNGNTVASGIYLYRILVDQKVYAGTLIVVR